MLMGEFHHNIDEKSRLIIPSKFRNELGEKVIAEHLKLFEGSPLHGKLLDMIKRTENGEHDLRL